VLSVFLARDDPYAAAEFMTDLLGWRLVLATPRDSDDRPACVALGDAEVMLGTARGASRRSTLSSAGTGT
jgi:catechol 2,3-dioxygenase-like lactoylglutathione lyase family enzyme